MKRSIKYSIVLGSFLVIAGIGTAAWYWGFGIDEYRGPDKIYVGYTVNFKQRLETHNSGGSIYTKTDRPWELVVCLAFKDINSAKKFEKYLKSQSGRAFIVKRFL